MREILFRGKRLDNGEWIQGGSLTTFKSQNGKLATSCYISGSNTTCVCVHNATTDNIIGLEDCLLAKVDPDTVGQYTGLTDENGEKIFEGDIVDVAYNIHYTGVAKDRIGYFKVVFNDGCFMKEKLSRNPYDRGLFHFIPSDECTVVGNIYDNPLLLEISE